MRSVIWFSAGVGLGWVGNQLYRMHHYYRHLFTSRGVRL